MEAKKILIIDDEPAVVEMIKLIVARQGYQAVSLNSSEKAIEVIKEEMPDLVLLDITMPEKDGYQICDEVRCAGDIKDIPIIVFTAQALEKDMIDKSHVVYGATDYIVKPFEQEELLAKIQNILRK
jgi:DNA-binding response OmpR family regulator